jgi:hypothetical protein
MEMSYSQSMNCINIYVPGSVPTTISRYLTPVSDGQYNLSDYGYDHWLFQLIKLYF